MFNEFPYSDFHELNLDWIIKEMLGLKKAWKEFKAISTMEYKGIWDITEQYPKFSIVTDDNGRGWLSLQPVPSGIELSNTDYWLKIMDYSALFNEFRTRLDGHDEDIAELEEALGDMTLGSLSDVNLDDLEVGNTIVWNGTKWVAGEVSGVVKLVDLEDVDTTDLGDGKMLVYDETADEFVFTAPSGGVTKLSELDDVNVIGAIVGDCLVKGATNWVKGKPKGVDMETDNGTIRFGCESGVYGYYKVGADTLTPFSSAPSPTNTESWIYSERSELSTDPLNVDYTVLHSGRASMFYAGSKTTGTGYRSVDIKINGDVRNTYEIPVYTDPRLHVVDFFDVEAGDIVSWYLPNGNNVTEFMVMSILYQ